MRRSCGAHSWPDGCHGPFHFKIEATFVPLLAYPQHPSHGILAPASLSVRTLGAAAYLACKIKTAEIARTHIESITSVNFYKIFIFLRKCSRFNSRNISLLLRTQTELTACKSPFSLALSLNVFAPKLLLGSVD